VVQPGLHEPLPLERGVIVAVLPQVALRERLLQRLGQGDAEFVVEPLDFGPERALGFLEHG